MEWRASHILVKEKGLADDLRKRLKSGAKFRDLAKEFSTCPSKSKSGDLGWFGPGKMVKAFEDAVKRMGHGSLSNVVKTQFGYHIIKKNWAEGLILLKPTYTPNLFKQVIGEILLIISRLGLINSEQPTGKTKPSSPGSLGKRR